MKTSAVAQVSPNHYIINFTDKQNSAYSIDKPNEFLSKRAIKRRKRFGIKITNEDLPVSKFYLDSLRKLGLKIVNVSKWTNSACVYTQDSLLIDTISNLSFVSFVGIEKQKKDKAVRDSYHENTEVQNTDNKVVEPYAVLPFKKFKKTKKYSHYKKIYGKALQQVQMSNCHLLHKKGYKGQGVQIAILDAGFYKVDELPAFESVRKNKQILGVKDFVDSDSMVYDASSHGMQVFSTMAGQIRKKFMGTAPKAKYWLLRTEQANYEYVIEEYNWLVGAEFADSAGVDLINSSLGYTRFDDNSTNHTYEDLDGNTTLASRAADKAAAKGILVVLSAGNEGDNLSWQHVSTPADADSVVAVGALKRDGTKAYFSSFGPSYDNRIKPEVCAVGSSSAVSGTDGKISTAYGTSFAAPIMAGMLACIIQAHPKLTNMQIIELLKKTSSQANNPDNKTGYGIPDMYALHLEAKKVENN